MTPEELGGASQSLFTHYNDFNTIKMRQEHYPRGTSFSTMAPGAMTVRPAEGERINDLIHAAHLQACATGCSYMVAAGSKRITVTPEQSIEQLHEAWENV